MTVIGLLHHFSGLDPSGRSSRCIYLAELSYPEIARFLGIGLSATKSRAFNARRRLKELLPVVAKALAQDRPSRTGQLRDTVLLFAAIHRRDLEAVTRLVTSRPSLAVASEDWSPEEAVQASLGYAGSATALVRIAETGLVEMARVLVQAGAPVDGRCQCTGGETPLWAASVAGMTDMVRYLLELGAEPNLAAFRGATPLHVAVQRGRHDVVTALLEAGADPEQFDDHGRTPGDWALLAVAANPQEDDDYLWTGIRALDLFAPIRRGSLQWWPAGYGLGQLVLAASISEALSPADTWYIGFDQPHVDANSIRHGLEECALGGHIHLAPRDLGATQRRQRFRDACRRLSEGPDKSRVVICLVDEGHVHDVQIALPSLLADHRVLTTIVIEAFTGSYNSSPSTLPPEAYDQQLAFDRRRARQGLYPAIDPLGTLTLSYPNERHARLAERTRRVLGAYDDVDPELALPEAGGAAGEEFRAQGLIRYLAQPTALAQPFTSRPAEPTPLSELLDRVEQLLGIDG